MTTHSHAVGESGSKLKLGSGWFAAGVSFQRALSLLSDGAFKLFAYLSLQADRSTGCHQATQTELDRVLGKSRRIIGKYIAELEGKGICSVKPTKNQHARNTFELLDDYWPYDRSPDREANPKKEDAYVASIRDSYLATGCTRGSFGAGDVELARALEESGVPLELVQQALLLGACRKYSSWLNGGASEPIASLYYFKPLISEIQQQSPSPQFREYLQSKVSQLTRMWQEANAAKGCQDLSADRESHPGGEK